jgi:hypothetical protein
MAQIVLGIGTSHTPMLNTPAEDWPRFIELDRVRPHLDKDGRPTTYQDLLRTADPGIAAHLTPERTAERHQAAQAGLRRLGEVVRGAALDTLIVIGDD